MTHNNPAAASTSDSPVLRGSQQSSGEARSVASFTPGPWHYSPPNDGGGVTIFDSGAGSLAAVWPESLMGKAYNATANARLIANAPSLFGCTDASARLLKEIAAKGLTDQLLSEVRVQAAINQRAIAKARGEA